MELYVVKGIDGLKSYVYVSYMYIFIFVSVYVCDICNIVCVLIWY